MANPNPAADVLAKLVALSPFATVYLEEDVNAFTGPVRVVRAEVPPLAVFVQNQPGLAPEPYLGQDVDLHPFQVQVTVRSEPGAFQTGEDVCRSLLEKLQRQAPTSAYAGCLVRQAGPTYLGEDEERMHRFAFTAEVWWNG